LAAEGAVAFPLAGELRGNSPRQRGESMATLVTGAFGRIGEWARGQRLETGQGSEGAAPGGGGRRVRAMAGSEQRGARERGRRDEAEIGLRPAAEADAAAIATIYNQGIETAATLETELRTREERGQWLAARSPRHPVIVATVEGRVVGWGSLNPFSPRMAYQHVADFSVYVERGWRGRGVGRRMLERLIELARGLGYHKMVLSTFPTNQLGVALYERLASSGSALPRWASMAAADTLIMERLL
jgi:phosphinothricin acetyltransferase